jgi:hypothetical protein
MVGRMGQEQPTASRTSTFVHVARLVASIVVPVALISGQRVVAGLRA